MKRVIITIALMLVAVIAHCQDRLTLNVSQDARLLFVGDDKGNDAGTLNLSIASEWQGLQQSAGFMFIRPEFEIADLEGGTYRRYSANVGYTFNKFFETWNPVEIWLPWGDSFSFEPNRFRASASVGWGIIDYNVAVYGFGANFQLSYELGSWGEFFLDLELVDRKDLVQYSSKYDKLSIARVRHSGKFGFKVYLN